jgi:hypothetical protein
MRRSYLKLARRTKNHMGEAVTALAKGRAMQMEDGEGVE